MELSQLRAFVAVSRAGTVAAAAEALHVTSSPLSRTIRELERQVGGDLFSRRYHQFERTAFGDELLPLAVELVAQADEMLGVHAAAFSPLRIGATPWTSKRLTAGLQGAATASGARVELTSDLSSMLLHALRHGDLDLALVHLPTDSSGVAELPLARYRYAVFDTEEGRLPTGRPLALTDLAGRRVLTLPLMMQPVPMARMLATIHDAGVESVGELDLRDMIGLSARLRRTGELMLVCPSDDLPATRLFDFADGQVYPLGDDEIEFRVGLAWRDRDTVNRGRIETVIRRLQPSGAVPFIE